MTQAYSSITNITASVNVEKQAYTAAATIIVFDSTRA